MKIQFNKISNVVVLDVDRKDYPDFCDAYIDSCDIDGVPATEDQLDLINADGSFVHEQAAEEYMNYGV